MRENESGGLAALQGILDALSGHPDDDAAERLVRETVRRIPFLRLVPLAAFRDGLRRVRSRIARERRPEAGRADGLLAALEILCEEHDAAIAHLRCGRCETHRTTFHEIIRPLKDGEERVCDDCKERRLDAGWSLLATEPVDSWCFGCRGRKKPMHCVGPVPDPMIMRVCDRCADDLRAAGWRAAVTTVHVV